jgi:hypothetical protein
VVTCKKWPSQFAVRIRHAEASDGRGDLRQSRNRCSNKTIVYLERAIQLPSLLILVSNVNHCAAAIDYPRRLENLLTVFRLPSVDSCLALGQLAGRRTYVFARQLRPGTACIQPSNILPTGI